MLRRWFCAKGSFKKLHVRFIAVTQPDVWNSQLMVIRTVLLLGASECVLKSTHIRNECRDGMAVRGQANCM
jgi:hypothetical protein